MTFKQATAAHLASLASLGWAVSPTTLKVPHATGPDGTRLYFKPQAVYAAPNKGPLGSARSLHCDSRTLPTAALVREGIELARSLSL